MTDERCKISASVALNIIDCSEYDTCKLFTYMSVTLHPGLISSSRRFISSIFIWPTVEVKACSCRLVLLTQMSSRSIRIRLPTPDRHRASAAQDPTPPSPTMATVEW